MTSIGSLLYGQTNAAAYAAPTTPAAAAAKTVQAEAPAASTSAVNVTLSDAAKAALSAQVEPPSIADIAANARAAIDKLLAKANTKAALVDGRATIDLGGLDRRILYAVASNAGGKFTADEKTLAGATLRYRMDEALAGPIAASRITGDYAAVYKAGLAYLDKAGPEEKASPKWVEQQQALTLGLKQATATPGVAPTVPNDPVAAYIADHSESAPANAPRDIGKVADDVRAALDAQYAASKDPNADIDLADFDDRALAAMALDKGGDFSAREIQAARDEIRGRTSARLKETYGSDIAAGSADTLGRDLILRYASMSAEEREAQGWTPEMYDKLVQNFETSKRLASLASGSAMSPYGGGSGASAAPSLLDYLT